MKNVIFKTIICFMGLFSCQNTVKTTNRPQTATNTMFGKKHLEVNGMFIEWEYRKERVFFTISAPTGGWVCLGFNDKNDIVNTNLILCCVKSGNLEIADHHTIGMGNHQPTEKLGGIVAFQDATGSEKDGKTSVSFSMPIEAADKFHYALREGTKCWFICAFSAEDDFQHHSLMREHREVVL